MKCKCYASISCNDGANFYKGNWYSCEKKSWGYIIADNNGNTHTFTSARFRVFFTWQ